MQKIRFINYYGKFDTNIFMESDNTYGNYLMFPGNYLATQLQDKFNCKIVTDDSFDTIVFLDLDEELYNYAKSLPNNIKKILVLIESPIYTPFAHVISILTDKMWYKVISYNREFDAPNLIHYDIAITGIQQPVNILPQEFQKGCHIASYKNDTRGYTGNRDKLIMKLLDKNLIDVFGSNWPDHKNYRGKTSDKIAEISRYKFYLACENAKYSGYVTEKVADAILAERPSLYFGDTENAQRRFPDTFVELEELSFDCFQTAQKKLFDNYDFYYENVLKQKELSVHWCDSFVETLKNVILL